MTFIKICAALAICSVTIMIFSGSEKELTAIISSAIYVIVMIYTIARIGDFLELFLSYIGNINFFEFDIFLKICGISIISLIATYICESSGQRSIASAIEIVATVEILSILLPTFKDLFIKILNVTGD